MKTYFITGTSRGLGKALALFAIEKGHKVYGIGRTHTIKNNNYFELYLDVSNQHQVQKFRFPASDATEIVLINNAGIIGNIDRFSQQDTIDFDEVMQVNVNALVQICHTFLRKYSKKQLSIVNISSGAGKRSIPSWLAYCTSKAAVDMFSQVLQDEENELSKNTKVYALSPGVIDTDMQQQIRSSNINKFSSFSNFENLQKNGDLLAPETVADKIFKLLDLAHNGKVLCSINDIP